MAELIMKGAPVVAAMKEKMTEQVEALKAKGVEPCLTIIRVGARPDDLAYERGARKRMESVGIKLAVAELPEDVSQNLLEQTFYKLNEDPNVHGIMLFRPLPKHLSDEFAVRDIDPRKDVDCMGIVNTARVFTCDPDCHAPCTAQAVMEMLDFYGVDLTGRNVTVVGRSMVVGKPLAMMLQKKNATVTMCHTRTRDLGEECRRASVVCAAAGKAGMITGDMIAEGAYVADVGINVNKEGKLCGDVDYESVSPKAGAISPVPGGVGGITSAVLAKHVIRAAEMITGE